MPEFELIIIPSARTCFGSMIEQCLRDQIGNMYERKCAVILDEINKTVVCLVRAGIQDYINGRKCALTPHDFLVVGEFTDWFLELMKIYEKHERQVSAVVTDSIVNTAGKTSIISSGVVVQYRYRKKRKHDDTCLSTETIFSVNQYPECIEAVFNNVNCHALLQYHDKYMHKLEGRYNNNDNTNTEIYKVSSLQKHMENKFIDLYDEKNEKMYVFIKSIHMPANDFTVLADIDSPPKWLCYADCDSNYDNFYFQKHTAAVAIASGNQEKDGEKEARKEGDETVIYDIPKQPTIHWMAAPDVNFYFDSMQ